MTVGTFTVSHTKTYSYIFEAGKTADGKRRVIEKAALL